MNLFNYLMNKNNKELVDNDHMLEYLLNNAKLTTISGTELNITAKKTKINELIMTKESTQDGEPTPDNPVEVKTVKGYRNLFNKSTEYEGAYINASGTIVYQTGFSYSALIPVEQGNYILTGICGNVGLSSTNKRVHGYDENGNWIKQITSSSIQTNAPYSIQINVDDPRIKSIRLSLLISDTNVMLTSGIEELPYVTYGNNYVAVNVSDGTTTNNYPIPLNNNEIVGIGDYKDELIVDKNGHCWLNKLIGKVVLDGSESDWDYVNNSSIPFRFTHSGIVLPANQNTIPYLYTNYYLPVAWNSNVSYNYCVVVSSSAQQIRFRNTDITTLADFKNWLSTHNTEVYYALKTPQLIDLNTTVDLRLFKGANTITNSEDADMTLKYY